MKVTMKTLKSITGLTAITDSDAYTGHKTKWEYMYALEKLLKRIHHMEPTESINIDQYNSNGMYIKTVTFIVGNVFKECKVYILGVDEDIQDLIDYLGKETD